MHELDESRLAVIALILCDSGSGRVHQMDPWPVQVRGRPERAPPELRRKKILMPKVEFQLRLPSLRGDRISSVGR